MSLGGLLWLKNSVSYSKLSIRSISVLVEVYLLWSLIFTVCKMSKTSSAIYRNLQLIDTSRNFMFLTTELQREVMLLARHIILGFSTFYRYHYTILLSLRMRSSKKDWFCPFSTSGLPNGVLCNFPYSVHVRPSLDNWESIK